LGREGEKGEERGVQHHVSSGLRTPNPKPPGEARSWMKAFEGSESRRPVRLPRPYVRASVTAVFSSRRILPSRYLYGKWETGHCTLINKDENRGMFLFTFPYPSSNKGNEGSILLGGLLLTLQGQRLKLKTQKSS
jgi:hypothetical protein